jgi:hypothetical protein
MDVSLSMSNGLARNPLKVDFQVSGLDPQLYEGLELCRGTRYTYLNKCIGENLSPQEVLKELGRTLAVQGWVDLRKLSAALGESVRAEEASRPLFLAPVPSGSDAPGAAAPPVLWTDKTRGMQEQTTRSKSRTLDLYEAICAALPPLEKEPYAQDKTSFEASEKIQPEIAEIKERLHDLTAAIRSPVYFRLKNPSSGQKDDMQIFVGESGWIRGMTSSYGIGYEDMHRKLYFTINPDSDTPETTHSLSVDGVLRRLARAIAHDGQVDTENLPLALGEAIRREESKGVARPSSAHLAARGEAAGGAAGQPRRTAKIIEWPRR